GRKREHQERGCETIHARHSICIPRNNPFRVDFLIRLSQNHRMGLITVRAAADRLGVSYSTMKRWIATGKVRTTLTSGGHHRVADAEIDRLIAHGSPDSNK